MGPRDAGGGPTRALSDMWRTAVDGETNLLESRLTTD